MELSAYIDLLIRLRTRGVLAISVRTNTTFELRMFIHLLSYAFRSLHLTIGR